MHTQTTHRAYVLAAVFAVVIISLIGMFPITAIAADGVPYQTRFINSKGEAVRIQAAYIPSMIIDGYGLAAGDEGQVATLSNPEDIYIDKHDRIFVADTGKSRIIVFDTRGNCLDVIGEDILDMPSGVFVSDEGEVYVADRGKDAVFLFDPDGNLIREYGRPDSILFGANTPFKPQKLVVDKMGSIYIVSAGAVNGLIQLDRNGKFMGYFGSNLSSADILRRIQRLIFTEEQIARLSRVIPSSLSNVAIDSEGLIYTSTQSLSTQPIKKFNIAGSNILKKLVGVSDSISDITVDKMGNIFAVDYKRSQIMEYNSDGMLVFLFGGTDIGRQQMGRFKAPSGVATDSSGRLYILDKERNNIQVLIPTEFTNMVHQATQLYLAGKYIESKTLWEQVIRHNSLFELAHLGMGMALFKEQDYEGALEEFRLANYRQGYSDAYWEIRRRWIMDNLPSVLIFVFILAVLISVFKRIDRKYRFTKPVRDSLLYLKDKKFIADILQFTRVIKHPIDGFYEIKVEKKGSISGALFWLAVYTVLHIYSIYHTSYIYNTHDIRFVNLGRVILSISVPFFLWVTCNYLVSTIHDGEGSYRAVFIGSTSALMPVILFSLPLTLISNALTLMERVVYDFLKNFSILWSGLLMFLMVKEVHDYEIGQAVKNILLTLFLIICVIVIGIILFGFSNQLMDFVYSIYQEVKIRAR